MNLIAYLRVSTDRQADEGLGLEIQEAAVRKYVKGVGHRLIGVLTDQGVSGAKELEDRPGLAESLVAIRHGAADGIVVYRLDRLARDLVLQEQLLAEIRRLGGEIHTTSASEAGYLTDDPDDPSRKLIRQVLGAVNEYERSMISLRLRSGRRKKADNGGYAYGAPAFGQAAKGGALVARPDEQATIVRIQELHSEGCSLRQIAGQLTLDGRRTKRGGRWHPITVSRILTRENAAKSGPQPVSAARVPFSDP